MSQANARPVVFNGRFLTRRQSGVQRVARQLLQSIDRQLAAQRVDGAPAFEVICPKKAAAGDLDLQAVQMRRAGYSRSSQAWEQVELPALSRGKLLVNLCNTAPLLSMGGIVMLHDAQVFLSPESYSLAFVAWYRFAWPIAARRASRILTVSNYSKDMLVKFGVASADKISVVHNGVDHMLDAGSDPSVVERLGLTPGRFVVAMSNHQEHKNVGLLLKAFAHPTLADIPLVLFGFDGPEAYPAHPIPSNVIFAGHVTDAQMRAMLEAAACFAFPSTTEGFGLPPLEAMAVGCPAVVAPCGALTEVCGEAATYVHPRDVEGWALTLRRMVDDPAERRRKSAQGLEHAKGYTWARSGQQILAIIEEVAGTR